MSATSEPGGALPKYKIHWHVVLIHLPTGFFLATALFSFLFLLIPISCFEIAEIITLAIAFLGMIPVVCTGWFTWKGRYKGFQGMLFQRKILTAFIMLALSFVLLVTHILSEFLFHFGADITWRVIYFIIALILAFGAGIEGYYGGRLNHK
jgi:uncharacterized membrane protein